MANKVVELWPFQFYDVLEINFTFALTNVEAQGDRCYYKLWNGQQFPTVIGNWSLSFANDPPRLHGGDIDQSIVGFITIHIIMAEFPYTSAVVDGRLYYYYRIHVYIDPNVVAVKDTLYFGGAYMTLPMLQEGSLVRVKIKDFVDDVAVLHEKVVRD